MQLQTILNQVEKHKSFVYGKARLVEGGVRKTLEITVSPRKNGRPICSGCGKVRPGYDQLPERRFEFVPLWNLAVFWVYALRRVDCPECGVVAEQIPWARGKEQHTASYQWFLARWATLLSWSDVAMVFHTSWDHVYNAVKYAVVYGIAHRKVDNVSAIGVDEIAWKKGHKYLTLVYQIDEGCKRLLWVAVDRTEAGLRQFFDLVLGEQGEKLKYVCSDMWKPYLQVISEMAPKAVHVLDRFHIMALFGKALDAIRADEARQLKQDGYEPVLKHSRWCLLKRPENLTDKQTVKLTELLRYNLKSVRAYLQREDFQRFWEYTTPGWAGRFLDDWCQRAARSKIEPLVKVARTLRTHRELILNWFKADGAISAGIVEGFNNKAKLTLRKAYGFKNEENVKIALFHHLGNLPWPKLTHEFF